MKKSKFLMFLLAGMLFFLQFSPMTGIPVHAEEIAEGEEAEADAESPEGEESAEDGSEAGGAGEFVPSSLQADNGKYIALSFPDSIVPTGFTTTTVPYGGEEVKVAQMETKSTTIGEKGMVVTLVYLTDEGGANGDFYLCDVTEEAHMSDMIMIRGVDDTYIIILDPGDNINGPDGFKKRKLKWGSKSAVAWSLPKSSEEDEDEEKEEKKKDEEDEEDKESRSLFTVQVYAEDLLGVGAGAGNGGSDEIDEAAEKAMSDYIAESDIAHTNAAGLIQAQPDDFCLLYAVSESGDVGFYLYDIKMKTYQRYVDIPHGESDTLAKYRKQSRIRLFIIAGMLLIILVLVFILINMMVKRNSGDRGDSYKEAPVRTSRRRIRDEDEEDERGVFRDDEVERYEAALRAGRPQRGSAPARDTMRGDRGPAYSDNGSGTLRSSRRDDPDSMPPARDPYREPSCRDMPSRDRDPYRESPRGGAPARDPYREPQRREAPGRDPYRDPYRESSRGESSMRDPYRDPMRGEMPERDMSRRPRRRGDEDDPMPPEAGARRSRQGDDLDDDFTFEFLNVDK